MAAQPEFERAAGRRSPRGPLLAGVACVVWAVALIGVFAARQAPLGGVRGRLLAEDTGQPIGEVDLLLAPADASVPARRRRLLVNAQGFFHLRRLHAGDYFVSASTRAHHLPRTRVTIPEGRVLDLTLELSPTGSFLDVYVPQRVFVPGEPVQVTAHGFTREEALQVAAYRVDPLRVAREARGSLWRILTPGDAERYGQPEEPVELAGLNGLQTAARLSVAPPRDAEGVFTRRITLPVRDPGVYVVVCRGDGIERLDWLMITDLGLVTKHIGGRCLAYAVDLASGAPAAGAEVRLFDGSVERFSGRCDAWGLLPVPLGAGRDLLLLMARRGESMAFVRIHPGGADEEGQQRVFLYTDRPVYRPGQRVYFKGIARILDGADFRLPPRGPVPVEVHDSRRTLVYAGEAALSDYGSFSGRFALSSEAATGEYTLTALPGETRHEETFSVAAYRKPEYSVTVEPEQASYTRGESGWVSIEARYFFGAPVVGATVDYTILRAPLWSWDGAAEMADYGEESGGGEVVASGQARTDSRGRCRIRLETAAPRPASLSEEEEPDDNDYRYAIEATVTDRGRFSATGSAAVKVWRGDFSAVVEPGRFLAAPGERVPVIATLRDHGGEAQPGVPVELSFVRRDWSGDEFSLVSAGRERRQTDRAGRAAAEFRPPRGGSYQVVAVARDRRGNRVRASAYLWVSGEGGGGESAPGPQLQITTDRREYRPGDTARFLITTSQPGATALVTAEADSLLERHLVPLKERATPFSLRLTRAHLPNFYLSVCLVRRKEFVQQETVVNVSPRPRSLQVKVSPDRETYAPGDRAVYRIRTLDADGQPVPAEVSLGIVDDSLYAIREDRADILTAFYPRRYNAISTDFSFPQVYLSGPDKSGVADSVRKEFPDTALWRPAVHTDARGEAEVVLKIPDSLTAWRATARAHTRDTRVGQAVSRVTCRKELMVRLQAPRFFTARDESTVSAMLHNESGAPQRIQVSLRAEGLALEGPPEREQALRHGEAARLDWRVRAGAPGPCRLVATAAAHGGLRDAVELRLPVAPHGRTRLEAHSGSLAGDGTAAQKIILRPDAAAVASITLQMAPSLASGMLSALRYLAEYPYGCTEQTMSAFLPDLVVHRALSRLGMRSARLEKEIPEMVSAGLQRLYRFQHADGGWGWWEFDDSDEGMTAYVIEGLVEARAAGFAVNPEVVKRGVEWLRAREHRRLAQERGISPARLLELLRAARPEERATLAADARRGAEPAPYNLAPRGVSAARAQALLALARAGAGETATPAVEVVSAGAVRTVDPAVLARLALAASSLGRESEAAALRRRLVARAQESETFCHWGDPETTALALQALLRGSEHGSMGVWGYGSPGVPAPSDPHIPTPPHPHTPTPPIAAKAVRWLLSRRDGDHWVSTRATARVLFALVDYLAATGELAPDFTVTPVVNGHALAAVRFDARSLFRPEAQVPVPPRWVRAGENHLALRKEGVGSLYYTVRVRQFVGQEDLPVLIGGSGITVARTYHRLRPARDPGDGELRLLPDARPTDRFRAEQSYLGRIVVRAASECEHVVIEDPLPAGCEPLDRGRPDRDEWEHWWTDMDVRDDRIAFFARRLGAGEHVLEYYLRASVPGRYHVMPTSLSGMYDPALRAGGAESRVAVR
ncbi:MAG: hypothetical protein HY321_20470 [Armatimonadetes bacterium]|nr:hypothetical protein [Armatimonadota bacterium]